LVAQASLARRLIVFSGSDIADRSPRANRSIGLTST
jgi:hypothetical protein